MLSQSTLNWFGGDSRFHTNQTMLEAEQMDKWRLSLTQNPGTRFN